MKKCLKILGWGLLSVVILVYLAFLLVLPNVIDLNQYKPLVQEMAKEQAKLDIDFSTAKITTTPLLSAGVKINDIKIKLPDNSEIFSTDSVKVRIALPALLTLAVRVSCAEIENPKINLDIKDGKQYKIVELIEELVNAKKDFTKVDSGSEPLPFDPSIIRINVPAIKISNYKLAINDPQNKQNMNLSGKKLVLGYFNGKKAKIAADAVLSVDGKNKINANIALNSFIPKFEPSLDSEDDPSEKLEVPFVNPINLYKTYDLKTNINAKIKARMKNEKLVIKGFSDIENLTVNMSGYQLPESYIKTVFKGGKAEIDTDLYVTKDEHLQLFGKVGYGRRHFINMNIASTKIKFDNLITLTKAVLDTFGVENTLSNMKGNGYFEANANIKTNFKKIKSSGKIIVKDGGLSDKKAGLFIKNGNLDISLDNNMLNIQKAIADINGSKLYAQGTINEKAVSDIQIYTKNLSLKELYNVFAPMELKQQITLKSAILSLDTKIQGELKNARAFINLGLKNLALSDTKNTFNITNNDLTVKFDSNLSSLDGSIINKDFKFTLPATNSSVYLPFSVINLNENNIAIMRSGLKFNNNTVINFNGNIENYIKNPKIYFNVDGGISANDLKQLAGSDASNFIEAKGEMPVRVLLDGTMKKLGITAQLMTDRENYFSPVTINEIAGKQNIFQFKADYKGNRIKIKDTGIYTKEAVAPFSSILYENITNSRAIAIVTSTITRLDSVPYINMLRVSIPKTLSGSIFALPQSSFNIDKTMLFAFGETTAPRFRGIFRLYNINLPELLTTIDNIKADFHGRRFDFNLDNIVANESDFTINGNVNINALPILSIPTLRVVSNNLDVNKLLAVSESAMKLVPQSTTPKAKTNTQSNIPVEVINGSINFRAIKADPIAAADTTGRINISDNIFRLTNLLTHSLGGTITGGVNMNLLNSMLAVKVHGENFDVEKSLLVLANMKDALSGTASFDTDITINGGASSQTEQMKSLKGSVDFNIKNGSLGPFGKLENLILAENIRESQFFQTALGGVVSSLTTIDSAHFQDMNGHLTFNNGLVNISPITTTGKVLCLHIAGNMNLLNNDADMKLRARMGSQLSNMLGPLAAINPVNLVKVTPGLNVMAAQAFQFFCETVSQAEMDALPNFDKKFSNMSTTKFQVVLRGNLSKPLGMIKSFKWLALESEIEAAENFVESLPDPSLVENPETATYEEIMAAKAEQEALKAKEDAKPINRIKRFLHLKKD